MGNAKLTDFLPDRNNANRGTQRGRGMLEQSLQRLGAGRSILVDKHGRAIAGNKTLETAVESGFEDAIVVQTDGSKLVVVQRMDLDLEEDAKAKELAIADNRVGQVSLDWDVGVLSELHQEIGLGDWFLEDEIAAWDVEPMEEPPTPEEDEETTADLIDKAESGKIESRVKLGEIWALGRHRIACGDSTDEGNVRRLLGDRFGNVGMVWADPPYGIKIQDKEGRVGGKKPGGMGGSKIGAKAYPMIAGDESIDVARLSFETCRTCWGLKIPQIWWGANNYDFLPGSTCWIVWDKKTEKGDIDGIDFADAELAWCSSKTAVRVFRHLWLGMWKESEVNSARVHPTQKPIALCEWCFDKYGSPSDLIFDPFLGSAPSIIAAQKMEGDRTVFGFELSPDYCEVILRRYEEFTGQVAQLVGHL